MTVRELLTNRRTEITTEIEKLQNELNEIDQALSVLSGAPSANGSRATSKAATATQAASAPSADTDGMSKQDTVVLEAVKAGNRKPADVAQYIRQNIGVEVNDASIRTRLSRMKSAGKIEHDGFGWKVK